MTSDPAGTPGFAERETRLRSELAALPDPQQRLAWVVDRARNRPPLSAADRTEARLVPGCAARLWLVAEGVEDRCRFAVDSDSAILKAMAGLLCELYDGLPTSEVLAGEPGFLADTGLLGQLTENRRRTVARVREVIRDFARSRLSAGASEPAQPGDSSETGGPEIGWFDAHNHLQDERFGGNQDALVAACRAAGVRRMVVNGAAESDWPAVAALAARHPGFVVPAFGLHPWYVHERTPEWRTVLERFLTTTPGSTVGEIGIDRWILDCPPAARAGVSPELATHVAAPLAEQEEVFREQLELAARRELPASIHCLQAWGRLHEVLRAGPRPDRGFLLHSYGGPAELVAPLARLGARFGFPGYFLHPRKARQREAFRVVPSDRLLVETDAPDQRLPAASELAAVAGGGATATWQGPACVGADGRPLNHPANLVLVYRGLAGVLQEPVARLAGRIAANFEALFGR